MSGLIGIINKKNSIKKDKLTYSFDMLKDNKITDKDDQIYQDGNIIATQNIKTLWEKKFSENIELCVLLG